MIKIIIIVFVSVLHPVNLLSETILFKSGEKTEGDIIEQDNQKIILEKNQVKTIILKDKIDKIFYSSQETKKEETKITTQNTKPTKTKKVKKEKRPSSPIVNAIKSIILPGWGQWSSKRQEYSILYGGLILLGGLYYYDTNRVYREENKQYNELRNPFTINNALMITYKGLDPNDPNNYLINNTDAKYKAGNYYDQYIYEYVLDPQKYGFNDPLMIYYFDYYFNPLNTHKKELESLKNRKEEIIMYVAVLYIWNIIDAFIFTNHYPEKVEKQAGLVLSFNPNSQTFNYTSTASNWETKYVFGYSIRF